MAVEGREGRRREAPRRAALSGGLRGAAGTVDGDGRPVAAGPGQAIRRDGAQRAEVARWRDALRGKLLGIMTLARGIPGGFDLMLYGDAGPDGGAEE